MRTLKKAFELNTNGKNVMTVSSILKNMNKAYGDTRLFLVRIFELMDVDGDGKITDKGTKANCFCRILL